MLRKIIMAMTITMLIFTGVKTDKEEFREAQIHLFKTYYETDNRVSVGGYYSLGNNMYAVKWSYYDNSFVDDSIESDDHYTNGDGWVDDNMRHLTYYKEDRGKVFYDIYENYDEYSFTVHKLGWQY